MTRYFLLLLLSIIFSRMALGDTVVVENGDVLTGEVDSIAGGRLILSTAYAGDISIDMAAIREIETEADFTLRLNDKRVVGRFAVVDGVPVVITADTNLAFAMNDLRLASKRNLALASLGIEWNSRVDLALALSSGNSTAESYNTLIESEFKRDRTAQQITLLVNTEDSDGLKTKDQLDLDYGLKLFMTDQWFSSANAEYFSDPLKDVDQRISIGIGAGYQFVDNSLGAFSTELGLSAVQEQLDGDDKVSPAIRWGLDYNRYFFAKRVELFHRQSLLIIPEDDRGQVLSSSSGLRYALNHRIDTAFRLDLNYESDPIPGNENADTTYTLGLGIRF